ncbi:Lysophospholipase L1 [Neorhodopirellula lusitana]|uniref:Lysophospholipase L1 n=1 Tax=Neorhodopirellula lusitana TaxID=445327 RepID=A0ABY1QET6_9BACT|nr:FAD-dependent oxidoreductase [Neorhodopirellula lusitana]SMP69372.1 Lysophospholipase L1 [Neorhodopirellula lusitana]
MSDRISLSISIPFRVCLTAACLILASHVAGVAVAEDSPAESSAAESPVPEASAVSPCDIVCFGDSITNRGYPSILGSTLGVDSVNAGVGGNTTAKALRRMSTDVIARKPKVVVILFGTNDLRVDSPKVHVPLDKYEANLHEMVAKCRKIGAKTVICSPTPIVAEQFLQRHEQAIYDQAGGLSQLLESYCETAARVAKNEQIPFVDLNKIMQTEPEWFTKDGVHPDETSCALIAKHIAKAAAPLLSITRRSANGALQKDKADQNSEADIVIYGASSAGITAAVQAARMNRSVILIEPSSHIGGLTSGGLGATDIGNKNVIGGLSREFYSRVAQHYAKDTSWVHEARDEFFNQRSKRTTLDEVMRPNATMWTFEPHVAARIFTELLGEAGIEVQLEQRLASVAKEGAHITSITTENGNVYQAKMFIDATYEGDLMAKAGVEYRVGREANSEYDETLNGIRDRTPKNQIYGGVDPYVIPGDANSGLIPLIQPGDGGTPGEGDHRVQAYNFRLCFTDVQSNRLELAPPPNYDPARYELAARRVEKIVEAGAVPHIKQFCNPVWMPNRKTDINNSQGISTDFIGGNYDYPDGDYATRADIWQAHEDYIRGFWYFMSTSNRVPEKLRNEFLAFGPCKDEFADTQGWPTQLYVREARRMVADYVMTEANCRSQEVVKDSVGMAAYGMDSHNCQRIVQNGAARNEGDVQQHGLKPYPISYRSIVPKAVQCDNLAVPVCMSASHIAFGSIRMEPVFMVLGQSSAIAASLAIEHDSTIQQVPYQAFHQVALATGQVLKLPARKSNKQVSSNAKPSSIPPSAKWTNRSGDNDWNSGKNWLNNAAPADTAKVYVDQSSHDKAVLREGETLNVSSIYIGSEFGREGTLEVTGGKLSATARASRHTRIGVSGGVGQFIQTGGEVRLNALQIGVGYDSRGTYHLSGGQLILSRLINGETGSIAVGDSVPEGIGVLTITGGSLQTRSGITIGNSDSTGVVNIVGSQCSSIVIGTGVDHDGFWKQHSGSTLNFEIGAEGVTPILVFDADNETDGGDVHFENGAMLDVSFTGTAKPGQWDVMSWDGKLVDDGLRLSPSVDTNAWSFRFVDSDHSGAPDVLRLIHR